MRLKQFLLTEKTFNVGKDVDLLFNLGFKKITNILEKSGITKGDVSNLEKLISDLNRFLPTIGSETTFHKTDSSILQTPDAIKAHLVNPVDIRLGLFTIGSFYRPATGSIRPGGKGFLQVSLNLSALNVLRSKQIGLVSRRKMNTFFAEFTADRIRSAIAHELSHWISDSHHNFYMSNIIQIAKDLNSMEIAKLGKKNINLTHFEIDAVIHGIKQLKSTNKEIWDTLTLDDVFTKYSSIGSVIMDNLEKLGPDVVNIYKKLLVKRMVREKLLGKNMRL